MNEERLNEVVCQFQRGEDRGAYLLRQWSEFAPTLEIKKAVIQQYKDEVRHANLFAGRLKDLEVSCSGLNSSLNSLYDLAQDCVDKQDWVQCVTIQVAIECLAMGSFSTVYKSCDEETKIILEEVIADEKRHLDWGLDQLNNVKDDPQHLKKIKEIQKKTSRLFNCLHLDPQLKEIEKAKEIHGLSRDIYISRMNEIGIAIPKPNLYDGVLYFKNRVKYLVRKNN